MSGATYLIYADRYTGWTEVSITKNANTKTVSDILRRYFTTFGVPEEVSSDGGPHMTLIRSYEVGESNTVHHLLILHRATVVQKVL